ncbi:hypothetical protein [Micromonospora pisi]|uniref:hypothetical protein n=1 Tax=Micromonospora pisi TaxID=589240 RepID=UPI001B866437|nr:hypothetical protein [Micromonospora pisi]
MAAALGRFAEVALRPARLATTGGAGAGPLVSGLADSGRLFPVLAGSVLAGSGSAGVAGPDGLARRVAGFRGVLAFRGVADFLGVAGCRAGAVCAGAGACVGAVCAGACAGGAVSGPADGLVAGGSGPVTGVSSSAGPGAGVDCRSSAGG